jgi:hypothetical protein
MSDRDFDALVARVIFVVLVGAGVLLLVGGVHSLAVILAHS